MKTFESILSVLQATAQVMTMVPNPGSAFAGIAVIIGKIVQASIQAHAASTGQTVEEVIAKLRHIEPVP